MEFISVTVHTTTEAADIISVLMIEEGSEGTSVSDSVDLEFVKSHVYWDYAPDFVFPNENEVTVTGFFEVGKDLTDLKSRLADLQNSGEVEAGSLRLTVSAVKSEDYENEWKKYYDIMEIGGIAIVPEWLTYEGDKPWLSMNPGKAFGTGGHETTAMCLELMQDFTLKNSHIIDVGCGSGILGLAALKLGAKEAFLTDIDTQAVEAAGENAAANGLTEKATIKQGDIISDPVDFQADIMLANLTADILIKLAPAVEKMLKKGGAIVVSGIINSRADEVKSAFARFKLERNLVRGEWQAFSFTI